MKYAKFTIIWYLNSAMALKRLMYHCACGSYNGCKVSSLFPNNSSYVFWMLMYTVYMPYCHDKCIRKLHIHYIKCMLICLPSKLNGFIVYSPHNAIHNCYHRMVKVSFIMTEYIFAICVSIILDTMWQH